MTRLIIEQFTIAPDHTYGGNEFRHPSDIDEQREPLLSTNNNGTEYGSTPSNGHSLPDQSKLIQDHSGRDPLYGIIHGKSAFQQIKSMWFLWVTISGLVSLSHYHPTEFLLYFGVSICRCSRICLKFVVSKSFPGPVSIGSSRPFEHK